MHWFNDIIDFVKTLTFVDYVFFFAIVILLILVVTLLYFIKSNNDVFENNNESKNELLEITKKLETEKPRIEFTSYEKDQEDKAIISYDELLEKNKKGELNYDEELDLNGISVKKINLEELPKTDSKNQSNESTIRVISYQNEEKFLLALKQLQSLLN